MTIAIIGAGIAGLSCAEALTAAGQHVKVFDKGRGPGGRMSTRRAETSVGEVRWDHGAQYFTARAPAFKAAADQWLAAGAAAHWDGRLIDVDASGAVRPAADRTRLVGAPGMNAVIRAMAGPLAVEWAAQAARVVGEPGAWRIAFEGGAEAGPFTRVVCATPAEQVGDIFADAAPRLAAQAQAARSAPCWAVLAAYDAPLPADFDGARFERGPLAWLARNTSKPGRGPQEAWVFHASPDWSAAALEADPVEVIEAMLTAAAPQIGDAAPAYAAAHRWRYAMIEHPAETPAFWDRERGIGGCGDWRIGPRVEAGWESGRVLAHLMLS